MSASVFECTHCLCPVTTKDALDAQIQIMHPPIEMVTVYPTTDHIQMALSERSDGNGYVFDDSVCGRVMIEMICPGYANPPTVVLTSWANIQRVIARCKRGISVPKDEWEREKRWLKYNG